MIGAKLGPLHVMEEHHEAYFFWKSLGIQKAWCWHVDAHLDIGREGLAPKRLERLAGCRSSQEASDLGILGNCYLPWGGLHCGNYLYPAITEGIVGRLTWVIPPYLPTGELLEWSRKHLDGWFELSLEEWAGFRLEDGVVRGHALGILMEVGTWESLTPPSEPVLLDIDIDYFLTDQGEIWWESQEFAESVKDWPTLATTLAYSVKGGYTPTEHRRLARPFLDHEMAIDGYVAKDLDRATALYRCHQYESALETFQQIPGLESAYYTGSVWQKLKEPLKALEAWRALCTREDVPADGQAYLRGLCTEMCLKAELFEEAIEHATCGKKLAPQDYRHPWGEAVARESLGDAKAAIKLVRRALRLAENSLFSLKIRLALARLYRRQGQRELSKMELAQLALHDVTGEYRASTVLL